MNLIFHRRVAATGDETLKDLSSMPETPSGHTKSDSSGTYSTHETEGDEIPPTRELQQSLSNLVFSEDDDDDWRNDFLSPGSAISKDHAGVPQNLNSPTSPSESTLTNSTTSSERSSDSDHQKPVWSDFVVPIKKPSHSRHRSMEAISENTFMNLPSSSEGSSDSSHKKRHMRRGSAEIVSLTQKPSHTRHRSLTWVPETESSSRRSHRRVNTLSPIPDEKKGRHRRASSMSSSHLEKGRSRHRGQLPSTPIVHTLDSLYATLRMRMQNFGPCDFRVGQTWNLIGNFHFRRQECEEAIDAYEEAIECKEGYEELSDSDHIAAAYGNIGTVCWSTGDMQRSVTCLQKSLDLRVESEAAHGRDPGNSLAVATSYHQLGLALSLNHEHEKALDAFNRALRIREKALGRKSVEVARTLDAIGKVHLFRGHVDEAMKCHQEAYATKYEITGDHSPTVVTSLMNIGAAHIARENYKEAIFTYLAVRNSQTSELEKENGGPNTGRLLIEAGETNQIIADLYRRSGEAKNAEVVAQEALRLYQSACLKEDHPKMQALKQTVKALGPM